MMEKLYRVTTTVPEFKGHRDVLISWFVDKRASRVQRPYAELIVGYDPAEKNLYAEEAVDELFSEAEAETLADWLNANRNGDTRIAEAELPLPANICGFGAIAVGGPTDFLKLNKGPTRLGFKVLGYYDLRGHEPIDKSVPARHQFCSLYIIDGRIISDYATLLGLWRAGKIVAEGWPEVLETADNAPPA